MHVLSIIVAVVLVVTGIYFSQRNSDISNQNQISQEVLSEEAKDVDSAKDEKISPTEEPDTPTNPPLSPTGSISAPNDIENFKYPNSFTISSTGNSLLSNSSEDTDKITDWYQEKIKALGMTTKTFVKTKTNDNVLNKLVGSDGKKEVMVEISKESGESLVKISVQIESF